MVWYLAEWNRDLQGLYGVHRNTIPRLRLIIPSQVAIKVLRLNHDGEEITHKLHKVNGCSMYNRSSRLTPSLEIAEGNRSLEKTRPQEYCTIIWDNFGLWFRLFYGHGFALDG
jgi:hypothetical protein